MQQIVLNLELTRIRVNASLQLNTTMTMDHIDLIDSISNSSDILENVDPLVTQSQQDGDLANSTAVQAETAFNNNQALVDEAVQLRTALSENVEAASEDMAGLKNQLLLARQAALSVSCVCVC